MHSDHVNSNGMNAEEKGCMAAFGVWFVLVAALALGIIGVGIWAVIHVVNWLVNK